MKRLLEKLLTFIGFGPSPCSVLDDVPFPTSEEAKVILAEAGIDTTDLGQKCLALICERTGHKWKLTWPLDPCEYTCERCGEKVLH